MTCVKPGGKTLVRQDCPTGRCTLCVYVFFDIGVFASFDICVFVSVGMCWHLCHTWRQEMCEKGLPHRALHAQAVLETGKRDVGVRGHVIPTCSRVYFGTAAHLALRVCCCVGHLCVRVCVCVCVRVCVCEREREREKERERDREYVVATHSRIHCGVCV